MAFLLTPQKETQDLSNQRTIGIYCHAVTHFVETIAYWVSYNSNIEVTIVTPEISSHAEHSWGLNRITQYPFGNIEVISPKLENIKSFDRLYIVVNSKDIFLRKWLNKSKQIGFLTYSNYKGNWKEKAKELLRNFPYYLFAERIGYQTSSSSKVPYFFIKNQFFYSPSVHPQSIVKDDYRKLMFAPTYNSKKERNFKFSFMGNRNPPERVPILKQIKEKLIRDTNIINREQYLLNQHISNNKNNVLWIEYGDRDKVRGLSSPDYINALNQTDFCICPLGWGGNWTHRVIESLVRGAIPILEDGERYNIGLTDMKNCIVVKNNNWLEAIEKAEQINLEQLSSIKSNIAEIREKYLLPEAASKKLRESMGL